MATSGMGRARAVADLARGEVLATVELAGLPGRVFEALASDRIVGWWVRPGVFRTARWTGTVRVGGRWRAEGDGAGGDWALQGAFVAIEPARLLVHTYGPPGTDAQATTVTYELEGIEGGTRLTLRQVGLAERHTCANTCMGWETSFQRLAELFAAEAAIG